MNTGVQVAHGHRTNQFMLTLEDAGCYACEVQTLTEVRMSTVGQESVIVTSDYSKFKRWY